MTASYFASKSSETAGVVAISRNYSRRDIVERQALINGAPGVPARPNQNQIPPQSPSRTSIMRGAQIFLHRNFKVHHLFAACILYPHQIKSRALKRIRNVANIKKQKTSRRGVGLNR